LAKQQTILVVDDEKTIREVVRRYLELEGFAVDEADTGPRALAALAGTPPDLVVLDIMLPGLDGFDITRAVRTAGVHHGLAIRGSIPIILLTARTSEIDRVMGFEIGADDYVVKPFSPRELVARVKAVLRRSGAGESAATEEPLVAGMLYIDPRSRRVTVNDAPAALTAKEFDLLWFLARHPGQVFTRAQLLDGVWGYEFYGDESTVTVHVRRLREKIEADPSQPTCIQTVWGVGYRFETP
jgi:two-component system, OmpR family, response regulator ResD